MENYFQFYKKNFNFSQKLVLIFKKGASIEPASLHTPLECLSIWPSVYSLGKNLWGNIWPIFLWGVFDPYFWFFLFAFLKTTPLNFDFLVSMNGTFLKSSLHMRLFLPFRKLTSQMWFCRFSGENGLWEILCNICHPQSYRLFGKDKSLIFVLFLKLFEYSRKLSLQIWDFGFNLKNEPNLRFWVQFKERVLGRSFAYSTTSKFSWHQTLWPSEILIF